jgi:hypothetical protein
MNLNSSNYLYFKAPFRAHFSLQVGNVLSAGNEYQKFWKEIHDKNLGATLSENLYKINYIDNLGKNDALQFESVATDASVLDGISPLIIQIKPEKWINNKIESLHKDLKEILPEQYKNSLEFNPDSCVISIFKNTVANVDMLFKINLSNKEISKDFIQTIETWSNKMAASIIDFFYNDFIFPLIKEIYKHNNSNQYISKLHDHYGFPDIDKKDNNKGLLSKKAEYAVPLWVSRMLIIDKVDDDFDDLIRRWTITTKPKDEIIDKLKNVKKDEKNAVYIGWMHSVYILNINENIWEDACQAISLIQYYYTVLDSISTNLSQIIGISHKKKSVKQMQNYKSLLEEMVFITNLNKTEFADIKQSLQRNKAFFFNDLMDKWTVNNLFENVDKKIDLCKENIDKIYQKAFNRSQRVAELLLFFISGFAILEFLKGISEFFWSAENYKEEAWGLYALGKLFDPNTMLWFGISVFLLLFILYTTIIKRQK